LGEQFLGTFGSRIGCFAQHLGAGEQLLLGLAHQGQTFFKRGLAFLYAAEHVPDGGFGLIQKGLQAFLEVEQILVVQRFFQALVQTRDLAAQEPDGPSLDEPQGQQEKKEEDEA
jgi:hypothetical protein